MGLKDDNLFHDGLPGPGDADRWAAAVRAAADGELNDADIDQLREQDASMDQRLAFERELAGAVGRVMGGVSAPAGLRDSVLAAAHTADLDAAPADEDALAERLEARSRDTRDRSFWAGSSRLLGALAAVLVLTVGGMFIWRLSGTGSESQMLAYRGDLARFVSAEHSRTLDDRYAEAKYTYGRVDEALDAIGGTLDKRLVMPPCGGQTKFRGAAPCGVPGQGPSAHFQFAYEGPQGVRMFSLFVRQDHGELEIDSGRAYKVDTDACNVEDAAIYVWRESGLLYTFVSSGQDGSICGKLLGGMGIDEPDPDESI